MWWRRKNICPFRETKIGCPTRSQSLYLSGPQTWYDIPEIQTTFFFIRTQKIQSMMKGRKQFQCWKAARQQLMLTPADCDPRLHAHHVCRRSCRMSTAFRGKHEICTHEVCLYHSSYTLHSFVIYCTVWERQGTGPRKIYYCLIGPLSRKGWETLVLLDGAYIHTSVRQC